MISPRLWPSADTLNSAISRAIVSSGSRSRILITLTSLCSCLVTWSIGCDGAVEHDRHARHRRSSVGPTASVSMLNPRRANRPAMRVSTPGLFSTSTDSTCLRPVWMLPGGLEILEPQDLLCPWFAHRAHHVPCGGAGGDHRVAVLLAAHAHVQHHRALGLDRLAHRVVHLVVRLDAHAGRAERLGELHPVGARAHVDRLVALVPEQLLPLAHHAEVAVVHDEHLHGDVVLAPRSPAPGSSSRGCRRRRGRRRARPGRRPSRRSRRAGRSPSCRGRRS